MKTSDISSIGALNSHDGSINLAACMVHGSGHAIFVNVSQKAWIECNGDKELLKQLFINTQEKFGNISL
jgi:hypothetical protein